MLQMMRMMGMIGEELNIIVIFVAMLNEEAPKVVGFNKKSIVSVLITVFSRLLRRLY